MIEATLCAPSIRSMVATRSVKCLCATIWFAPVFAVGIVIIETHRFSPLAYPEYSMNLPLDKWCSLVYNTCKQIGRKTMSENDNLSARQLLLHKMREWSEECFSAGWMRDLEFDLWTIAINGKGSYGSHVFSCMEANKLYGLALGARGWWRWHGKNEEFVGLGVWRNLYCDGKEAPVVKLEKENERLRNHVMVLKRALGWLDTVLDLGHQDCSFFSGVEQSKIDEVYAYAYEVVCGRITE